MTRNQIRAFFAERGIPIEDVAVSIRESRPSVSSTINYIRLNERIRRKLERKYGIKFDASIPCVPAAERVAA